MKTASLTLTQGKYTVEIAAKVSRVPCKKPVWEGDRIVGQKEFFVPLKQATVTLKHLSGDSISYRATWMGSKLGVTKSTTMPRGTVRSKLATGPADIETDVRPVSVKLEQAISAVQRMTGFSEADCKGMFNVDLLIRLHGNVEAA
jgi:hypothetical protein